VPGLTINQAAAAGGIENVYSTSLTGPFANLITNLFAQDAAGYANALSQLDGNPYADYLQSLAWSSDGINRTINERIDCADDHHYATGNPGACRLPGQVALWGRIGGSWTRERGDIEAILSERA